jgi:hypothetical protein
MPSTYTQNLGVELPATGEQANTWGLTVNRNMHTVDTAINGNVQIALSSSPYLLAITDGAQSPLASNPVIQWTGAQTGQGSVHIDYQSARQHLYIMSNRTSGGFGIAFAQGMGSQFVLQNGYDAILYADGGLANANVAAALASPQFNNLLATGAASVTGNLTVGGSINGIFSTDAPGNVHLTGGLGVGSPTAIPDPLTINGINYGQLRLVQGSEGVIFRNDATSFYLLVTASGDPYGAYTGTTPLQIDLASRAVGMTGWVANASYGLSVPSIHTSSVVADGAIQAGGALTVGGGINNTNARSYFTSGDSYVIGVQQGSVITWIGTNTSGQFQISAASAFVMLTIDATGHAVLANQLHILAGGVMFPDGTVQTTAGATGTFPGNVTVNGQILGPSVALQSPILYCPPYQGTNPSVQPNSLTFSYNQASNWVTLWVTRGDGSQTHINIALL